jgi:hypothetical protein
MTMIPVCVLDHSRILDLAGVGLISFLYPQVEPIPNPYRIRFGLHFSPWVHSKPEKKNLKGTKKTLKTPDRNLKKNLERNIFIKPDGFGFGCQISPVSTNSGVKFNPTIFFRKSGFRSTLPTLAWIARVASTKQTELFISNKKADLIVSYVWSAGWQGRFTCHRTTLLADVCRCR